MNRKPMATGREAQQRKAAKANRPASLVPKRLGAALVDKSGHLYSEAHLNLVRAQPCIVTRALVGVVAHHPKEAFSHLMKQGGKISDFLAVPILHTLHDPGYLGSLHKSNSMAWWRDKRVDLHRWIKLFLRRHYQPGHPGADYALAQITIVEQRRTALQEIGS